LSQNQLENITPDLIQALKELAKKLDSEKAYDISLYNTSMQSSAFSHLLICSSLSALHMKKLAVEVESIMKSMGWRIYRQNPQNTESGWLPLDFGDFIVHIFSVEKREHYKLEEIISESELISWKNI
jgi:ribosome-associated protein